MNNELMMLEALFETDERYGTCPGITETWYDYIALCEVGEMYRDIRRLRERENYYEALCA